MQDNYLCRYRLNLKDDKEVYEFLRSSFPELEVNDVKGSYLSFCISMLCYICYPLSISVLVNALGTYIGGPIARTRIVEMLERKDLKRYEFDKEKDMNAQHAYYLSSTKKESLLSTLPNFLKDCDTKFRKSAGKVPMHDYGCGISLLQIMLLKRPFVLQKEVGFTSTFKRKEKGSLCVDALVTMSDTYEQYFIEQDMGTERISTLCGKLYSYEKHGLCRDRGALIFSCHVVMPYSRRECYNKTQLTFLMNNMKEEMADDICDYYEYSKDILDAKKLVALKDLMITVGVAKLGDREAGGGGAVTAETEITLLHGGGRFSLSDMEDFIHALSMGNNEYRIREYNREQTRRAMLKFRSMCELLCAYVSKSGAERGEVRFITSGFPCIVYPSVLLSHCFDYLNRDIYKNGMVKGILEKYFENMDSYTYRESGASIFIEGEGLIYLNNTYESSQGAIVCVEHIGIDVSAFVRFYYLYYLRSLIGQPLYLIGVGSRSDILYMANLLRYYTDYGISLPESGFFLSFIDAENMESLQVPYKKEDGEILLVDLISKNEELKRKQLLNDYYNLPQEVRASMSKEEKAKALGLV